MQRLGRTAARAVIDTVLPSEWDGTQESFPVGTPEYDRSMDRIAGMERTVLVDLRSLGVSARTVHDVTCDSTEVAEVLIDHLMRPYPMLAKEHMLSALASPVTQPYFEFFCLLLSEAVTAQLADALTRNELIIVGTANVLVHAFRTVDDLVPLIDDPELGTSRILLMGPLKPGRYRSHYERWASDPDLAVEASSVLRGRRIR